MRPVILEMDGFASFRQKTVVDFRDVDYFALVGQTGAGKSTVIDAIAFALYGQVARWDDARAVSPALAPTVNRGTVKLVFDLAGDRYIAMREVRRAAKGNVSVKTARLERLDDPQALGDPNDGTTVLEDGDKTKAAVEELLGLDFNQFTKCVALPQGAFAEFLHAAGKERDAILTKLLGIDVYVRLGQRANARAAHYRTQAETYSAAIDASVDASDEALADAEAVVARLEQLHALITPGLVSLATRAKDLDSLRAQHDLELSHVALLKGVQLPKGIDKLDSRQAAAQQEATAAQEDVTAAEKAEGAARGALQAHSARATLQQVVDDHGRRDALDKQLPELTKAAEQAAVERKASAATREDATAAHLAAEAAARAAAEESGQLEKAQAETTLEQALLASVKAPKRAKAPVDLEPKLTAAQAVLMAAREERQRRREALEAAGDVAVSERASASLATLLGALAQAAAPIGELITTQQAAAAAVADAVRAEDALAAATAHEHALRERGATADLRRHLSVGEPCPVCEQTVAVLPEVIDGTAFAAAATALGQAQDDARRAAQARVSSETLARTHREQVTRALALVTTSVEAATEALALTGVTAELPPPTSTLDEAEIASFQSSVSTELETLASAATSARDELATRATARATLVEAVHEADRAATEAEEVLEGLREQQKSIEAEHQQARQALVSARDPLVSLGAPAVDDSDVAGSWQRLEAWATERRTAAAATLKDLNARTAAASKQLAQAEAQVAATTKARDAAQGAYDAAVAENARAAAAVTAATERREELNALLATAEPLAVVQAALVTLGQLEVTHAKTSQDLETARLARDEAEALKEDVQHEVSVASAALTSIRDPLVSLGAPALSASAGIGQQWSLLVSWAAEQLAARQSALGDTTAAIEAQEQALGQETRALTEALAECGVVGDPAQSLGAWVPAALARSQAQAQGAVTAIHEARERAADLLRKATDATEQSLVAGQLGTLLSINKFPRWITISALEVLVVAASETLMDLSGGQFELTLNERGEFTVIDHNDADAERIVKTLSGGETFQASLALALALSTHLSTLASDGGAKLDAIFIDEGFGTLDEQTLGVVATTLENLANSAGRMVGVITHVAQLAERVPVRFTVSRDRRGSSVFRESV